MQNQHKGFTLVELLVVVAIIGALIGIIVPALGMAREQAEMVIEMSASRNLMLAHRMYADDHGGRLITGYDTQAKAWGPDGEALSFPTTARYVWRLVPYLDNTLEQTVLVHQRLRQTEAEDELSTYAVSVHPSLGINGDFVGGTWGGPYQNWLTGVGVTVTRASGARDPSRLIVFASARGGVTGNEDIEGHHFIQPAYGASYDEAGMPGAFGNVHPRYDGKAVVGFLDTHAGTLSAEELEDMTYWSDAAARSGKTDWTLQDALNN